MIADLTDSNRILAASITGGRPVPARKMPEQTGDVANGIKRFEKGMPVARPAHQSDNAT
jgi:hypothetical protein